MAIHFMSGTGNSFRAATWMTEVATNKHISSNLNQILRYHKKFDLGGESNDLLGMVFPTHGFTAPWNVIKHVLQLPPGRGKHAFVVVTRAGTRIASISFPGLEGTAGYLIALILMFKGYMVHGVMGLDMPSNWMSLHSGINPTNSKFIIDRAKVKLEGYAQSILEGNKIFTGIVPLLLGLLLSPISLGYLVIGRFFLAKLFFASGSCTSCGLCAKSCPVQAIKMVGGNKCRPYWTFACESCMRCMGYCPNQAVEVSHSFAIILYFITSLPVSLYVLNGIRNIMPIEHGVFLVRVFLDYIYVLVSLFLAYYILYWLIKIPLINKLCTYTTLTRFYRRYHEPDTALIDIVTENKHDLV